jgi:hypothetical protein
MTRSNESQQPWLLLATGPLFACATSVFPALIAICVLLACTVCASIAARVVAHGARLIVATAVSAIIVAALLITLITLGFSDVVAAFGPQMMLAAFAALILSSVENSRQQTAQSISHIALVGFLCELIGRGTLLGDYELAFAGATHQWQLRTSLPPISILATPAGALLVAATINAIATFVRFRNAAQGDAAQNDKAAITEPRGGRRVRVTGHIS